MIVRRQIVTAVARVRHDHPYRGDGLFANFLPVPARLQRTIDRGHALLAVDRRAAIPPSYADRKTARLIESSHPARALCAVGALHHRDRTERGTASQRFADEQVNVRLQEPARTELQN